VIQNESLSALTNILVHYLALWCNNFDYLSNRQIYATFSTSSM